MTRTDDPDDSEDAPTSAIPADVAALFAWARLGDATYLDFAAARRRLRSVRGRPGATSLSNGSPAGTSAAAPPQPEAATAASGPRESVPEVVFMPSVDAPGPSQNESLVPDRPERSAPEESPAEIAAVDEVPPALQAEAEPVAPRLWLWSPSVLPRPVREAEPAPPRSSEMILIPVPVSTPAALPIVIDAALPVFPFASSAIEAFTPEPVDTPTQAASPPQAIASFRWTSLHGRLPPLHPASPLPPPSPVERTPVPVTAIFALTGGSGKTCLLATLGRILRSAGESVLLAETNPLGALPLYFAAEDAAPGPDSPDRPEGSLALAGYDLDAAVGDSAREAQLVHRMEQRSRGASRLIIDLSEHSGWFLRRLTGFALTVLVPVTPTMSSVITLQAVERFFRDFDDPDGRPILPYYLINQFDEEQVVHRDVRDFLQRRMGEHVLPTVIRTSPCVGQAFARGMTVVDFAPDDAVSDDYRAVAGWLRAVSPEAQPSAGEAFAAAVPLGPSLRWVGR